jgi:hypothetical protein
MPGAFSVLRRIPNGSPWGLSFIRIGAPRAPWNGRGPMSTTIRFRGGGERVIRDDSFVTNEVGVRYTEESVEGHEQLHVIPWSVIHEIVQDREAIVVTHDLTSGASGAAAP